MAVQFRSKCLALVALLFVITDFNVEGSKRAGPRYTAPKYRNDSTIEWMPRIVGGTPARIGEFSAKISVRNRNGAHLCGGTLINPTHIVTSAQCVTDNTGKVFEASDIQAMGDDLNISPGLASESRQIRLASLVFVSTSFNLNAMTSNIAVIRVESAFQETVSFYPAAMRTDTPPNNRVCQVSGWGASVENGTFAEELQRIDVGIISEAICNRESSYNGLVGPGMFCAGSLFGGRGACQGDMGGGLMCDRILAGIVSFGHGCGEPNLPNVYTDVSVYRAFIDMAINWSSSNENDVPPVPTTIRPGGTATSMSIISAVILLMVGTIVTVFN